MSSIPEPTESSSQPLRLKLRLGATQQAAPSSEASSVISEDELGSQWDDNPQALDPQQHPHAPNALDALASAALGTPVVSEEPPPKKKPRNRKKAGDVGPGKAWRRGMKGYQNPSATRKAKA
jgi:hypothetical protein